MNHEQIIENLEKMLSNPKAKNFINHLVRSYVPMKKVKEIKLRPSNEFKCVLSHNPLISSEELIDGLLTEEAKKQVISDFKDLFNEKTDNSLFIDNVVGGSNLAVSGENTNTFMSYSVYQLFYNWVITKSLNGNKHINWLLGSIRHASFMERAKNINDVGVQNKVNKYKTTTKATYTLGDSSEALLKLKSELENKK